MSRINYAGDVPDKYKLVHCMKGCGDGEVHLHSFLAFAVFGDVSTSRTSVLFTAGEKPSVTVEKEVGWSSESLDVDPAWNRATLCRTAVPIVITIRLHRPGRTSFIQVP